MNGIPEATPIILTDEERAELEDLARSMKAEHRLRQRARIILMAAEARRARHCVNGPLHNRHPSKTLWDRPPPEGHARSTGPLTAKALRRCERALCLAFPARPQDRPRGVQVSGCESNDPASAAKAADVVGLRLAPPENALVICSMKNPRSGGWSGRKAT
jgi:hypothetical protein